MRIAVFLAAFGLLLVALAASSFGLQKQTSAAGPQIEVDNFYFCDPSLQGGVCERMINTGDTVTWEVEDGTHTVTQCNESFSDCPLSGGFDAGQLSRGQDFSHTFNAPGTFEYRCNIHPTLMRGRITVLAAATSPTASPSPAAQTATPTPASAPKAGGQPPDGDAGWPWWVVLAAGGGLLLAAGALLALQASRRP